MGYSIQRLEIIKARLLASNPRDLELLFTFTEQQLASGDNHQEKDSPLPDIARLKAISDNVSAIDIPEMEFILDFVAEKIQMNRITDKAEKILDTLDKVEFYSRELKYSRIEKFLFNLTSI